jgi:hypothetical protein
MVDTQTFEMDDASRARRTRHRLLQLLWEAGVR